MNKNSNSDTTNDENQQHNYENKTLNDEKVKIQKQIEELKDLISGIELELEIKRYGEYEIVGKSSLETDSESSTPIRQNIRDILEYELFKLSGIYCSKFTENECVFNFSSSTNFLSHAVQILTENESIQLGAWVMPWGITIDKIEAETPLQTSKDVIPFLKNCQRSINCYNDREEQFKKLKEFALPMKNFEVDATLGYITILCHFLNVYDNSTDRKFNLTIKMFYGVNRIRPNIINVEWNLKVKLSENVSIKMKTFAKSFKTHSLVDALKNIMIETHPIYAWKAEEYTDNVLDVTDIHYSSESDSQIETSTNEEAKHPRKRIKSRHLRKRGRKPLSNVEIVDKTPNQMSNNTRSSEEYENNNLELSKDISNSKLQSKKRGKQVLQTVKNKQQITPTYKNIKSKQTRLSFKGIPISSMSANSNERMKQRVDLMKQKTTSTPMVLRSITHKRPTSMQSLEISPIAKNDSTKSVTETTPN